MLTNGLILPILAFTPFILLFFLLVVKKQPLIKVSLITLILTSLLTLFVWRIYPNFFLISLFKGLFVALDIFFIVFGAILFLNILKKNGIIENIFFYLERMAKDYRVLVIILAWFLSNFLEGTAGFGTPATVVAPLLIALGLSPLTAVVISLLGNSTAGAFGAVGTPTRIGFFGINSPEIFTYGSLLNMVGFLVPVFMLWILVSGKENRKQQFLEALPFAIWAGIAFVLPSYFISFFGQEFPSIIGSVIGLFLVLATNKIKLFTPKTIRRFSEVKPVKPTLSLTQVLLPYGSLILLLILGKIIIGNFSIFIPFGINHSFSLFNPGFAFIVASFLFLVFSKSQIDKNTVKNAFSRTLDPFLVIIFMSIIVQLMLNSGTNSTGILSFLEIIAQNFKSAALPFWTPFIGAFGAFITGSVTVSNIMFGGFLHLQSLALNFDPSKILALQLVGAAAGNMIALADVLVAQTVVNLKNQETAIIKKVIVPCFIYIILVSLIGIIIT